jgi:hypothetical protein
VARGPSLPLYGGNAMGGVINIRTRPIDRREIDLSGQRGSYDTTRLCPPVQPAFLSEAGRIGGISAPPEWRLFDAATDCIGGGWKRRDSGDGIVPH